MMRKSRSRSCFDGSDSTDISRIYFGRLMQVPVVAIVRTLGAAVRRPYIFFDENLGELLISGSRRRKNGRKNFAHDVMRPPERVRCLHAKKSKGETDDQGQEFLERK